ncbi:hypothetical protein VE02_08182 [Pseudogymnoascus sp. 03VT05]|nr:hypothetical protein VE02_08182 [Pseudogymnoascus sp. 03VT05]
MPKSRRHNTGGEVPGDPEHPDTFIKTENREKTLASYLGLSSVGELRVLAISWPVLHAFVDFEPISLGLLKASTFRLLHTNEDDFRDDEFCEKWPLLPTDSKKETTAKKAR